MHAHTLGVNNISSYGCSIKVWFTGNQKKHRGKLRNTHTVCNLPAHYYCKYSITHTLKLYTAPLNNRQGDAYAKDKQHPVQRYIVALYFHYESTHWINNNMNDCHYLNYMNIYQFGTGEKKILICHMSQE